MMASMADNPRAVVGNNNPPELTPLEAMTAHIGDLFETAQGFLDGEPIANQETADLLNKLIDDALQAEKDGTAARIAETKPLDDAKKAIMDAWRPLVDKDTGKCRLIISTARKALTPWLNAEQDRIEAEAAEARRIADEKLAAAQEAMRTSNAADLAERERVEGLLKEAGRADRQAHSAGKQKAMASGGRRASSLRTVWTATLTNPAAALKHYRDTRPDELKTWLAEQALRDVAAGVRSIPGVIITSEQVAQ